MRAPPPWTLVALGGALGALARWGVAAIFARRFGGAWPYGTLFINVSGCFAIALFLTYAADRLPASDGWRYFFPTGFVGAYTTFSTYQYETQRLFELGSRGSAGTYFVLSNVLGFGAVLFGIWLARRM